MNCKLKFFNLENTYLGDKGSACLFEAINKNFSLLELNLAKN